MLLGPILIMKCPHCAGLTQFRSMLSSNNFGATHWTDGAAFDPDPAFDFGGKPIVKCAHCDTVAWIDEFAEVEEWDWFDLPVLQKDGSLKSVPRFDSRRRPRRPRGALPAFTFPNVDELVAFADGLPGEPADVLRARLIAWRTGNDARRCGVTPPLSGAEIRNLNGLAEMPPLEPVYPGLARAEVLRELGRFDEARRQIEALAPSPATDFVGRRLLELVEQRDTVVREIVYQ